MSSPIKNHKTNGIYKNIDRFHRNFTFKENLIKNPLVFSTKHPSYSYNVQTLFETPLQSNRNPRESSYTHSPINYKAPFLKTNHRFFWTMAYETPVENNVKFWGSSLKDNKGISQGKRVSEEKNMRKTFDFPLRPRTKQKSRCSNRSLAKNCDNETGLFQQKDANFQLRETLNYSNDIEEFEYNVPRIVKPTNLVENMHGLINLRKKEADFFEKVNENSGRTVKDPFSLKIAGKTRRIYDSVGDVKVQKTEFVLKKAIYEQNFVKSRKLMGKSLQNFKKFL